MKKIVLFVSNLCTAGGTERVTALLSNEFIKKYNCSIITLFNDREIYFKIDNRVRIFNVCNKRERLRKIFFFSIIKFVQYLRKNSFDIVIIVGRNNNIMPLIAACFTSTKIIFCEHSTILNFKFHTQNLKTKIYNKIFQFFILKTSDKIIVLTNNEKQLYLSRYNIRNDKILIIPNYLNEKLIEQSKFLYNKLSNNIITVGSYNIAKGYEYLVKVAKLVFAKHPDWQWDIYGDGDKKYKNKIINLIEQNDLQNHVILQGNRSDIYDLYQNYSIYVMTSRYEGLPMVLLEAKAKKLPIVSFDINSGPSDIIRDGIDGFLINPFDCQKMADKICELIENPELRQKFSDNAHGNIDKFSKEKIIKQWCDLIDSLS